MTRLPCNVRSTLFAAMVLLSGLRTALSQEGSCTAIKPSVGDARVYKVGANSFHVPIMDYLTEFVGSQFDPPISFVRYTANAYLKTNTVQESLDLGFDFMLANPYASSCYQSEGQAVSLATQLQRNFNNMTQYGAVLYALKNRTDIQTLEDIKGKIVGTNKITSLATHLCYDVLLRNGIHHLQDPKQTIFFKTSNTALPRVLSGEVDVGCASTQTLELFEDLDLSQIRILNPQNHTIDGIQFPYAISSQLVPQFQFQVFPHVDYEVKTRVQEALLAMRAHADMAPSLLACLNATGCPMTWNVTDTTCLDSCFESVADQATNCDTTPTMALKAYEALGTRAYGFVEPQQNLKLRDIQESTGFLVKSNLANEEPSCVRMKNIADAVTCPEGHFRRSSEEIVQQCNASGFECFDRDCFCSPCVKAFEVDFFPMQQPQQLFQENGTVVSRTLGVGSGCPKFSVCGTVQQEHVLQFRAIDNKERPNATLTGALLRGDEAEEPFTFENNNGTFQYDFWATSRPVGEWVIKIQLDDEEIPESPFRVNVEKRDCAADTGDERREPDELGQCICERGTVDISGNCVPWLHILLPSLCGLLVVSGFLFWYCQKKRRQQLQKEADSQWIVRKEELLFDTPPKVLGKGAFGVVLLGEFRGTKVAVKRVIPPAELVDAKTDVENPMQSQETISSKDGGSDNNMQCYLSFNPTKSGAPNKGGAAALAARMSAADLSQGLSQGTRETAKSRFKELKDDFIEEIRFLSRLRHPNVTTLMGAVLDDEDGPLLVMDYMDRGSLMDLLESGMDEELLLPILRDVSQGMRFLHASDPPVIHGDLKARNILIDAKYHAKVADFGLSHTKKKNQGPVGTPYWMAPELLRGETLNTRQSDMYSFGVLLYEAYSKKEPFTNVTDDAIKVLAMVASPRINRRPPIPKACPSQIKSLMVDCYASKPEHRPSFEEVDQRLKRVEFSSCNKKLEEEMRNSATSARTELSAGEWGAVDCAPPPGTSNSEKEQAVPMAPPGANERKMSSNSGIGEEQPEKATLSSGAEGVSDLHA